MKGLINQLYKAFENRVRLGIMSALLANDEMDFNSLKALLEVTDGNLASHLKALEKEEYISVKKSFVGRKPHTNYEVTRSGKKAFENHLNALEALIKNK
ncbi:transcriptional regulator [Fulvivirga sp. RKSG066]|uniref:transcriptional regulator n=1 Tax=Fulvivirga aurantia TaxID=2529383 RepID=UPI001626F704|nr:transcriptional regulator [Fulvivirga aurantia]